MSGSENHGAGGRPLRRAIFVLPSAFTLGNLFLGFWALVAAYVGDLSLAGWLVVFAAVSDWLDGRAARLVGSHSRFGAELDSLADMVSFGVAPAFIVYQIFFTAGDWSWVICFLFAAAVALRLARFNVEQAGVAKRHFLGLPSPAAGTLLAAFYPFSQTDVFASYLDAWPWARIVAIGMLGLSALMLSYVPYPVLRPGIGTRAGRISLIVLAVALPLLFWRPSLLVLPLLLVYAAFGLARAMVLQLLERFPNREVMDELRAGGLEARRRFPWRFEGGRRAREGGHGSRDADPRVRGAGRAREAGGETGEEEGY